MKIFISCSSNLHVSDKYNMLATDISTMLAKLGHKLVFGGLDTGMMGKCFYTFKYENGKTKGITTLNNADILESLEVNAKEILTTSFDKNKMIYLSSDACLFLPGGIETLSEFFSILEELKIKKDNKPIILFNYNNFYTPIISFLNNNYKEYFIDEDDLNNIVVIDDIESLENYLNELERKEED